MQIFNIIKLKTIILLIFFCFLGKILFSQEQSAVKNIYIELNLKGNENYRAKAVKESYKIALARYFAWITIKNFSDISILVNSIQTKDYISGYSIESEKYKKDKYSALITVNFDKKKVEELLQSKGIKYFLKKGPKTLIIPIIKFESRLVLWDDPNPWFDIWLRRPLDSNLNLFILPSGEADDLITLSAEDALNLKYYKIKKLSNKYNTNQVYILLVDVESYNKGYNNSITAYDGFTKENIFELINQKIKKEDLNKNLYNLANTFANYLDDLWVKKNLEKISSKTSITIEVQYKKYRQWIDIKKYLKNSEKIISFNIIKMSNKKALIKLNILSLDALMKDLKNTKYLVNQNKNNLFITIKDETS